MDSIFEGKQADIYQSDRYLQKHPSLHEEDSKWKFDKLTPFLDTFSTQWPQKVIRVLDIGGGAGLVLKQVSNYLETEYSKTIKQYALDLSLRSLRIQRRVNPDLKNVFNGDVCNASLPDKGFDLTLMVDVLEHLEDPAKALREIKRISRYAILKVPLENNLYSRFYNFIKRGGPRRHAAEHLGHINYYNIAQLSKQIKEHAGDILMLKSADVYSYYLSERFYKNKTPNFDKVLYYVGKNLYKVSPKLASYCLNDFAIVMVHCF